MQDIVEDLEDERETEGDPADCQSCVESGGGDIVTTSTSVEEREARSDIEEGVDGQTD